MPGNPGRYQRGGRFSPKSGNRGSRPSDRCGRRPRVLAGANHPGERHGLPGHGLEPVFRVLASVQAARCEELGDGPVVVD